MRIAVIPAYEPDEQLLDVVSAASEAGFKVIVVDDGSGEQYTSLFQRCASIAVVISYPDNKGKGHALKQAFAYIQTAYRDRTGTIVTMDCDGQHLMNDALKVCEVAEANPQAVVLGSRKQSKQSPWKSRFGNGVTKRIFRLSTGRYIEDTQTGLRAFQTANIRLMLDIPGTRYEYEMNMLLHLTKIFIPIVEVPIQTVYIQNNLGSHFRAIRDSVSIYAELLKYSLSSFIGFIVDFMIYSIIVMITGPKGIILANIVARSVSATVNFTINYKLVYRSRETLLRSAFKYFALACGVLAVNSSLLYVMVHALALHPLFSKVIVELLLFFASWFVQRSFVFVKRKEKGSG